ncbi:MAG TPA: hypothetical protein VGS10_11425 [Terracidiphilus sp.]|nr:hypothetical protein [Terracidiphilus sp.]
MKITDLTPDDKNANKGTRRGRETVKKSLEQFGAGRSVLIDRDGRLIAGNKTVEQAAAAGISEIVVVPTDGTKLVAVQRTDLSLDDPKGRGLAVADNRTGELGLEWDADVMADLASDLDLQPYFSVNELAVLTGKPQDANDPNAEWQGMPDYTAENQMGVRQVIVHFAAHQDVEDFARLIGQRIGEKTKYLWYPEKVNADLAGSKYV